MVLESRKWRLLIWAAVLVVSAVGIIGWADPASYALQRAEPTPLLTPNQLDEVGFEGRFATVEGVPDGAHAVTVHDGDATTYWVPLAGFADRLFVVTPSRTWQTVATESPRFTGKVLRLSNTPHVAAYKQLVAPDASLPTGVYVLLEGEQPAQYRPALPLVGGLLLVWLLGLVGFVRVWRRRRPRSYRA